MITANEFELPFQIVESRVSSWRGSTEAVVKVSIGEQTSIETAEGESTLTAVDSALRRALGSVFPQVRGVELASGGVISLHRKRGISGVIVNLNYIDGSGLRWESFGHGINQLEAEQDAVVLGYANYLRKERPV